MKMMIYLIVAVVILTILDAIHEKNLAGRITDTQSKIDRFDIRNDTDDVYDYGCAKTSSITNMDV